MAIDTTTISYHKLIKPAVGMAASYGDIENALGVSSGDLGTLCRSDRINRWAKYKPVIRASKLHFQDQMNTNGTWKDNANWWRGDDLKCGINIVPQTNLLTMCRNWVAYGWEYFWQYNPPTGTSSAPFRQTDFNYYLHKNMNNPDYDKPYHSWSFGGTADEEESTTYVFADETTGEYEQSSYTLAQGAVYRNEHNNNYLLQLSDLWVKDGAATSSLEDTYFGVVVVYDIDGSQPMISLNTCPFKWSTNVPSNHEWHPAGKDLRFTPQLRYAAFFQYNKSYLAFPVCVKTDNANGYSDWTADMCKMTSATHSSKDVFDGNTRYIIPLPLSPKTLILEPQKLIFSVTLSVVRTTADDVKWGVSVRNVSQVQYEFNWDLLYYDNTCYPKDSTGATDYSDPLVQTRMHVYENGGSSSVAAGGSVYHEFTTSTRHYNHGYYAQVKVYSLFGYIDKDFASVDYNV